MYIVRWTVRRELAFLPKYNYDIPTRVVKNAQFCRNTYRKKNTQLSHATMHEETVALCASVHGEKEKKLLEITTLSFLRDALLFDSLFLSATLFVSFHLPLSLRLHLSVKKDKKS